MPSSRARVYDAIPNRIQVNRIMFQSNRRKTPKRNRTGAAVAEFAICLPAILLLVLGAIECTSMIFLRQSLHIAAYEGIRVAIKNDTDSAAVLTRCNEVLTERNIASTNVTTTPGETSSAARGDQISVQVSAASGANSILPLQFFSGDLQATATMIKE